MSMTRAPAAEVAICPYCLYAISTGDPDHRCPGCQTLHHQVCWEELGGCATYGCPHMVEVHKTGDDVNWWGQTEKKCPVCAETISMVDLECPFCHTKFKDIQPMQRKDLFESPNQPDSGARASATRLLILSTLGILSPITLLVGVIWYLRKKEELLELGGSTRALVLISILVSTLYIVIILGGWALFALKRPVGAAGL